MSAAEARGRPRPGLARGLVALCGVTTSAAAIAVQAAGAPPGVRLAAVLAFFLAAPGAALLAVLQPRAARFEVALVMGLSLAVVILASQAMLLLHAWSPSTWAYAGAAICIVLICAGEARSRPAED